jgi:prophage regulatory protein
MRPTALVTNELEKPVLETFCRLRQVETLVGLKKTQIGELIKRGEFPKPIALSDSGRAIAWLESELAVWQASRIAKRATEPRRDKMAVARAMRRPRRVSCALRSPRAKSK